MKKNVLANFYLIFLTLIVISCNKETTTYVPLSPGTYLCTGTLKLTVGTNNYTVPLISFANGSDYNILGFNGLYLLAEDTVSGSNLPAIRIVINSVNTISTGTYSIPGNNNEMGTSITYAKNDSSYAAYTTGSSGTITITETSATTLQGTFSANLSPVNITGSNLIITNGSFNCIY